MGKKSNKDKEEIQPIEEVITEHPIPSKLFIKNLAVELKDEKISPSVFNAFVMVAKPIDLEENYRKLWKQTFKRS